LKQPIAEQPTALLVLLSPDEIALVSTYRVCTPANRQNIRCIAYAAAAHQAEKESNIEALLVGRPGPR
jgi:hypothetical protein